MICARCTGSGAGVKALAMAFCMPCATLLASNLPDPYWKPSRTRALLQREIRRAMGWWGADLQTLINGTKDPLWTGEAIAA
jgi:hypothetical protein